MEEVQQGSNGTELQTATIPTTITSSQFSQIAQQVTKEIHKELMILSCCITTAALVLLIPPGNFVYDCLAGGTLFRAEDLLINNASFSGLYI